MIYKFKKLTPIYEVDTNTGFRVFLLFFKLFFLSFTILLLFLFAFYEIFLVNFTITWVALLLVFFLSLLNLDFLKEFCF